MQRGREETIQSIVLKMKKKKQAWENQNQEIGVVDMEYRELRNQLIDIISESIYKDQENRKKSLDWLMMQEVLERTVMGWEEEEGKSFLHYFNASLKNAEYAEHGNANIPAGLTEITAYDIREWRKMKRFCRKQGIDIDELSMEEKKKIANYLYKKENLKKVDRLLQIDRIMSGMNLISMDDQMEMVESELSPVGMFTGNAAEDKDLVDKLAKCIELVENKSKKGHSSREILKCLITQEFGNYIKTYDKGLKEEFVQYETSEEVEEIRCQFIVDEMKPYSKKLFQKLLVQEFLNYVLQEPEPNTVERVRKNNYREKRGFNAQCVADYFTEKGEKLSKYIVTNVKEKGMGVMIRELKKMMY